MDTQWILVGTNKYNYSMLYALKYFDETYEEAAIRINATNKGSEYCTDCTYCTNCESCSFCYNCKSCTGCSYSKNLVNCLACFYCSFCNNATSLLNRVNNEKLK